jgi:hypothetical protein
VGKIIRFYQTEDGRTPVKEFLDSLPGKTAQKVVWVLMLAEELDILPTTYFKKLVGSEDIWECRVSLVPMITGSSASMPAVRFWCLLMDS